MPRASKVLVLVIAICSARSGLAQTNADVCARARSEKAAGPTPGSIAPAEVCRVLSVLAHDSLEGRGTATVGGARAARFIAAEMRAAGLEPGGDSGYFQRIPVVRPAQGGRAAAVASFAV